MYINRYLPSKTKKLYFHLDRLHENWKLSLYINTIDNNWTRIRNIQSNDKMCTYQELIISLKGSIDEIDEFMQTVYKELEQEIANSFLEKELDEDEIDNDLNLIRMIEELEAEEQYDYLAYERIIFNDPATIVIWADGTRTVVKACKEDKFDKGVGLKTALLQRVLGKNIDKEINKIVDEDNKREKENQNKGK